MRHIEENLQIACVTWFGLQYPGLSPLLHHSPNGGSRNVREGARFKAMGTRAGFPDLILLVPSKGHHALFVELKTTARTSGQTAEQKRFQKMVEERGYRYTVCRTFEEFRTEINQYLNILP